MPPSERARAFGSFVRTRREALGLSLRAAADAAGLDFSYLSKVENGNVEQPKAETLNALASALQVPLDDLYALVGYTPSTALPTFPAYLRAKYQHWPREAHDQLDAYFRLLAEKYDGPEGGPSPGEDEDDEPPPRRARSPKQHK